MDSNEVISEDYIGTKNWWDIDVEFDNELNIIGIKNG